MLSLRNKPFPPEGGNYRVPNCMLLLYAVAVLVRNPGKSFLAHRSSDAGGAKVGIYVFQTTKEGNFRGANAFQHDVDVVIELPEKAVPYSSAGLTRAGRLMCLQHLFRIFRYGSAFNRP
ncbi:MAG: hypothetical protein KDE33_11605 [Bacteroidetes bacterium]|nr:hypothetical protein [Bacteroidota bacterium]